MSYQKILVDNVTCSRRFHITFDDAEKPVAKVQVTCPFCDVVVFEAANHPAVKLARQENLIQAGSLSDNIVSECHFRDTYSEKTVKGQTGPVVSRESLP